MPGYLILTVALVWCALLAYFAREFTRLWREPVLRAPVLIFESDDWGAGSTEQAAVLSELQALLARFRDAAGRHPVTTLGIILAIADTQRIRESGGTTYFPLKLSDPRFDSLRASMRQGAQQGIFALHLHGMEHYWPPALMQAAATNPQIRDWLQSEAIPATESLPSPLQSRWIDASNLPSAPLPETLIQTAVTEEADTFKACFGEHPRVAVATTFIWTEPVEKQWAQAGVDVVVTPGTRHTCRDATGKPAGSNKQILNGETSTSGQVYLVRDIYFEPSLGHAPAKLPEEVTERTHLGRPSLVEMHRFNFMGTVQQRQASLLALESGIARVLEMLPDVHFMTTLELADAMRSHQADLLEGRLTPRIRIWLRRIRQIRGFSKLARISGLALPLWMMAKAVGA